MIGLAIEPPRTAVAPGEPVTGSVVVVNGGNARSVAVQLRFVERTQSFNEVVRTVDGGEIGAGELTAGQRLPFTVQLPADALPGVSTEWGSLFWELAARADVRGVDSHAAAVLDIRCL